MTTLAMPICGVCTHLHLDDEGKGLIPWRCDAFPDGIPQDILRSQFDHRAAHEGDQGITFEPRPDKRATALAYVNVIFPPKRRQPAAAQSTPEATT